ncbi:MAG: cytochrome c oxidase subunit 3 family protein [Acidobacteriota bacterium]|nr:cytochrome c oxidase subunit 3 family protein [Blastocatellia bacterium]MDW8413018.1 cytochrome c oxidase subunit 3 family protein [Acidobacteriota bacterium]
MSELAHKGHPEYLQHHFAEAAQQEDASKIGMWLFLATEVLLFSGLFLAFAVMRQYHYEAFREGHHHLNKTLGVVNTLVLICSSLTMALGVRAAQTSRKQQLINYLVATLLFAATFLVIKYFEYSHKIHEGLLPGRYFTGEMHEPAVPLFFGLYFLMTGLHGLHVVAGMIAIGWVLWRGIKGHFHSEYYTPVENVGLYWHLVDLIWIYLFPLLYLLP